MARLVLSTGIGAEISPCVAALSMAPLGSQFYYQLFSDSSSVNEDFPSASCRAGNSLE